MSFTNAAIDPSRATTITQLRVRFCETDLMGIVHHGSYLVYFEAGRVEWLRRRGVTYTAFVARGLHLPVVDAHVHYTAPSRFDDLLDIETTLTELRSVSLKFSYRIRKGAEVIADGYTRLGCIDDSYKLVRFSDEMRSVLLSGESVT